MNKTTFLITDVFNRAVAHAKQQGWVDADWTCGLKIDPSRRRVRSWGGQRNGKPFISLAINSHLTGRLTEYDSFKTDSDIGSVTGSVEKALAALTMHELAHAIQYSGDTTAIAGNSVEASNDRHGHGALWRKIYRELRVLFVNNVQWAPYSDQLSAEIHSVAQTVTFSRKQDAQRIALYWFRKGHRAPDIIKRLVKLNVKKTTAAAYVYEIKSLYSF